MTASKLLSGGATVLSSLDDAMSETEGLGGSLAQVMARLEELMDAFWVYIVIAMAAVVVIWGAYIGIRIAIAHRNEDQVNARGMVKNLVIGVIVMFVVAVGAPLLIEGLYAWSVG